MSNLNVIQKLLNNNNLAIPNLYYCRSYNTKPSGDIIIGSQVSNISDDKFNTLLEQNTNKKSVKQTKRKKINKNKKSKKKK